MNKIKKIIYFIFFILVINFYSYSEQTFLEKGMPCPYKGVLFDEAEYRNYTQLKKENPILKQRIFNLETRTNEFEKKCINLENKIIELENKYITEYKFRIILEEKYENSKNKIRILTITTSVFGSIGLGSLVIIGGVALVYYAIK